MKSCPQIINENQSLPMHQLNSDMLSKCLSQNSLVGKQTTTKSSSTPESPFPPQSQSINTKNNNTFCEANFNPTGSAPNSLICDSTQSVAYQQSLGAPCGQNCKRLRQESGNSDWCTNKKQKTAPSAENMKQDLPGNKTTSDVTTNKQQMTVIALHKKQGEESLNKFKEEVRKYAVDHTFKETAKKYGIHHSTVSGWVKESEKQENCSSFGDFYREKGDDKFISWLRECRETGVQVSLGQVKSKVG